MITETCHVEDDAVYIHEVDRIIAAFYLLLDVLFPEVSTVQEVPNTRLEIMDRSHLFFKPLSLILI